MDSSIFIRLLKATLCMQPLILMLLFFSYLDDNKIFFPAYSAASGGIIGLAGTIYLVQKYFSQKAKVHVTYDYTDFFKHIMHRHNVKYQLKDLLASYEHKFTENNPFKGRTIFIFHKDGEWYKKEIDNVKKIKPISISTFQNEFPIAKKRFKIKFYVLKVLSYITKA